jgi:large subunit ribosomal protein L6
MSRIGKAPIAIPKGVTITLQDGNTVTVKGPKGELTRTVPIAMQLSQEEGQILVKRPDDEPTHKSLHGLTRTLIANMVEGVT